MSRLTAIWQLGKILPTVPPDGRFLLASTGCPRANYAAREGLLRRTSRLRFGGGERGERRSIRQMRRKIMDENFHRRVPETVETEEIHFFRSLFGTPFFHGHAIGGDEHAGAVVTETAVHKDFFPRIVAEKKQELGDLFVAWRRPAIDGDVDKAHAERFNVLAFPSDRFAVLLAQIDDGGDAQDFQLREAHFPGLRATVEDLRDFSGVRNSVDVQFLSMRGLRERRRGCSGVGLCRKQDGHEKKSE